MNATNATWIQNVRRLLPGQSISHGDVLLEQGCIAALDDWDDLAAPPSGRRIDGRGRLLTPGLIDLHTHGIGEAFYESGADHFQMAADILPRFGTTCALPTLYKCLTSEFLPLLEKLGRGLSQAKGICFPGFHLEGPFLALPGAGAATLPGDVGLMAEVYAALGGQVAAVSISPDTQNILPVIEWLTQRGVVSFMTHTRASAEQTAAAIDAGARHATHFYNVFPVPQEKEPGLRPVGAVEAILADRRVTVDFITDGVHVPTVAIKAALAAKGYEGVMVITDSTFCSARPPGVYDTPWGYRVRVKPGDGARIEDPGSPIHGCLAGSALTMDQALHQALGRLDLPLAQGWAMGTLNQARLLGLKRKGDIRVGADADLVLWNDSGQAAMTWVAGELVYNADDADPVPAQTSYAP